MSVELHPQILNDEDGGPRSVLLSRAEFDALLQERRAAGEYKAGVHGEPDSVMLSIDESDAMLDELEDYADAKLARKIQLNSKPEDYLDWDEFKTELRAEGKLG